MRTMLFGLVFLLVWYVVLGLVVAGWLGWPAALLFLAACFVAAHVDRLLHGRLRRAARRARTYLALRAEPEFRERMLAEVDALLADALALEQRLANGAAG
jgi:hypothetical protein